MNFVLELVLFCNPIANPGTCARHQPQNRRLYLDKYFILTQGYHCLQNHQLG